MDFFRQISGPLKVEMNIVATTLLWLFLLHFTLYGKPQPEQSSGGTYEQPSGYINNDDAAFPVEGAEM